MGFAVKATYAEVDGKAIPIYKEPKTDSSKKSARGLLKVESIDGELVLKDNVSWAEEDQGELHLVFKDSQVFNIPVFEDIKKLACESLKRFTVLHKSLITQRLPDIVLFIR